MPTADSSGAVGRYYFALPRLAARLSGGSAARSEQNVVEAHVVGALVHVITFVAAARLLLGGLALWQQIVLLLPLMLLVWAWWSLFFHVGALLIKLLRSLDGMRGVPDRHAQSGMVCILTTLLAAQLLSAGSWMRVLAFVWLIAVTLNLAAAAVLTLIDAEPAR